MLSEVKLCPPRIDFLFVELHIPFTHSRQHTSQQQSVIYANTVGAMCLLDRQQTNEEEEHPVGSQGECNRTLDVAESKLDAK